MVKWLPCPGSSTKNERDGPKQQNFFLAGARRCSNARRQLGAAAAWRCQAHIMVDRRRLTSSDCRASSRIASPAMAVTEKLPRSGASQPCSDAAKPSNTGRSRLGTSSAGRQAGSSGPRSGVRRLGLWPRLRCRRWPAGAQQVLACAKAAGQAAGGKAGLGPGNRQRRWASGSQGGKGKKAAAHPRCECRAAWRWWPPGRRCPTAPGWCPTSWPAPG